MGRAALVERNKKRENCVALHAERRSALVSSLRDKNISYEARILLYSKLRRIPRDASPSRIRHICSITSRSRANYRDFGVSRIVLRKYALSGVIPGLVKGSL